MLLRDPIDVQHNLSTVIWEEGTPLRVSSAKTVEYTDFISADG